MLTNFKIDQTASFPMGVIYLACEPKLQRGSQEQDRVKASGQFKWESHLLVGVRNGFGQLGFETLKVGIATDTQRNPMEGVNPQTPVQLIDFEIGVMEKTKRNPETGQDMVIGVNVWYRASEIRPTSSTAGTGSKAA